MMKRTGKDFFMFVPFLIVYVSGGKWFGFLAGASTGVLLLPQLPNTAIIVGNSIEF